MKHLIAAAFIASLCLIPGEALAHNNRNRHNHNQRHNHCHVHPNKGIRHCHRHRRGAHHPRRSNYYYGPWMWYPNHHDHGSTLEFNIDF